MREDYVIVRMSADPEPDTMVLVFDADCTPVLPYAHRVDRTLCMDFLEMERRMPGITQPEAIDLPGVRPDMSRKLPYVFQNPPVAREII